MARRARLSADQLVGAISAEEAAADRALQAGRHGAARRHHLLLLTYSAKLADLVHDIAAVRELSISYHKCGDFFGLVGELAQAEHMYRRSLEIISQVAATRPGDAEYRWDVAYTSLRVADLLAGYTENWRQPHHPLDTGEADRLAEAERVYVGAQQALASCVRDAPANWGYQQALIMTGERLGFVAVRRGAWDDAVQRFTAARGPLEDLVSRAERAPATVGELGRLSWKGRDVATAVRPAWVARRALACNSQWLGHTARLAGQAEVARGHYADFLAGVEVLFAEQSFALRHAEYELRVAPMVALRDISIAHEHLGDLAAAAGDAGQAQRHYRESLAALQRIPERLPQEVRLLRRKLAG